MDVPIPLPLWGDASLCAQLYRECAPKLLAYLRRHVPAQEDAEDLLLEVFLSALEHEARLANLDEDERRAWLGTVARNRVFDFHRRTRKRSILPLERAEDTPGHSWEQPENMALRRETYTTLHNSIQNLSAIQQEILQLRFILGLRSTEIARVLHKREGAVRTMLSRTLNTLRDLYKQKEGGVQ
ncbi:RNA polymerase sigma factor [Ktedonobacter racemifer]|nr:sigma-70 family RNA polymerase sigma factor [Ktedonobacter racemifer]